MPAGAKKSVRKSTAGPAFSITVIRADDLSCIILDVIFHGSITCIFHIPIPVIRLRAVISRAGFILPEGYLFPI